MAISSMISSNRPVKVTIETQDGEVYELTGVAVEMTMSYPYARAELFFNDHYVPSHNLSEYEITIHGTEMWRGLVSKKVERDVELRRAAEWKCPYCGHVNPREARYCGEKDERAVGCGGHRSFIYEE